MYATEPGVAAGTPHIGRTTRTVWRQHMITNDRIAEALEKAADLYESEKVDWCQGNYVENAYDPEPVRLSVCASQALRMACGEELVWRETDMGHFWGPTRVSMNFQLFNAATLSLGLVDQNLGPSNG